jgi:hypothetical protein
VQGTLGATQTFRFHNTSNQVTPALSVVMTGGANFLLESNDCQGATLAANDGVATALGLPHTADECDIVVRFQPRGAATVNGTVTVSLTAGNSTTGAFRGTGQTPAQLTISPALSFGPIPDRTVSGFQVFTIRNVGQQSAGGLVCNGDDTNAPCFTDNLVAPFTGELFGSDNFEFANGAGQGTTCLEGQVLDENEQCNIAVRYVPVADSHADGTDTDSFPVFAAGPGGVVFGQVSGTSTPQLSISTQAVAFGNNVIGGPATTAQRVTITNNGSFTTGALNVLTATSASCRAAWPTTARSTRARSPRVRLASSTSSSAPATVALVRRPSASARLRATRTRRPSRPA